MNDWGNEILTGTFGAGDAEAKCTDKEQMIPETLDAARRSVEVRRRKVVNSELNHEDLDAARRSVEKKEGGPIRYAFAIDEQLQSAFAPERAFPVCRPNSFSANRPSVYRVGFSCHRRRGGRS